MNTHRLHPDYKLLLTFFTAALESKASGTVALPDCNVKLEYTDNLDEDTAETKVPGWFASKIDNDGKEEYLAGIPVDTAESMADEVYFAVGEI